MYRLFVILSFVFLFYSCRNDSQEEDFSKKIVFKIGISKEPAALLPFKRRGRAELQINPYIFPQIADFDPVTLKLIPSLIEKIPSEIKIDTGKHKGLLKYSLELRKDAKWDNGMPITAKDYIFSVKILLDPMLDIHPAIRNQFKSIRDIVLDKNNPQRFDVYTVNDYMLSKELVTNMELYPEYFYDSLHVLRKYDYPYFLNSNKIAKLLEETQGSKQFAKKINGTYFMREHISNIGPYKLLKWEANRYLSLGKKENWWGEKYSRMNTYLKNNPDKIIFKIIPDKTTALAELKNDNIDLLSDVPGIDFKRLKEDTLYNKKLDFYSPLALKYSVIIINNRNKILKDKRVRKALAHLTDVDFIIKTYGTGEEKRLTGPIHLSKQYYDKSLTHINYNVHKAKDLLSEAGWKDSDGNGVLDKIIDGKKTEFDISFKIIGRKIEKNVALLLKENAKKAGINIEIINKTRKEYRNDRRNFKFDLLLSNISKDLVDYDPYPRWHSDNINPGKSNLTGFHTDECDLIIEKIIRSKNQKEKKDLYKKFQEIIYENQPAIFLYVPTNNIIVNNKYKIVTSIKRPGYFANTVELKSDSKTNLK